MGLSRVGFAAKDVIALSVDDQQILRMMDKLDRIAESLGEIRGQFQASQRSFQELSNQTNLLGNSNDSNKLFYKSK